MLFGFVVLLSVEYKIKHRRRNTSISSHHSEETVRTVFTLLTVGTDSIGPPSRMTTRF